MFEAPQLYGDVMPLNEQGQRIMLEQHQVLNQCLPSCGAARASACEKHACEVPEVT